MKTTITFMIWALAVSAMPLTSFAEQVQPFQGHGRVGHASDGSGRLELGIILDGEIARQTYIAMRASEVKDECTGGFQKRDGGGLVCITSANRNEYQCSVGIILGAGQVTHGPLTC